VDDAFPAQGGAVRCPHCLDELYFDMTQLYEFELPANVPRRWDPMSEPNEVRRQDRLNHAFLKCPNESPQEHFLPVPYISYGQPLTIAFVGQSGAGKSHLLAAMMAEIGRGGLEPFGIRTRSVNADQHRTFVAESVNRLEQGQVLPRTDPESFVEYRDALLMTVNGQTRPVAFFDVAGESLKFTGPATQFLWKVDALIFVVDPMRALRLRRLDLARETAGIAENQVGIPDPTFGTVLDRIERNGGLAEVPTALVVNKCDLLRFEPPVDRWLHESDSLARIDPTQTYEESRDVYAFLRHQGASAWLRPFNECRRCTLHFVSATGTSATALPGAPSPPNRQSASRMTFAGGARPRRVLGPLLSVFSMCGLLEAGPRTLVGEV
jgi:hypothetical protein